MAEGLARAMAPPGYRFLSAGSEPGEVNPLAIETLAEQQVDISDFRAKGVASISLDQVDTIVTLCAEEVCPVVPGRVRRFHWPLPDPKDIASFRAVRDELRKRLPDLWNQPKER
jgi:arsenate reductase